MARMRPSLAANTNTNTTQQKPTELERSIATMQNIQPKVDKNVLTMPVEDFIRHRDSVVTGLTTLIGNINDFNRAFIRDTNQMLGLAGAESSYAITNFLQTASSLSGAGPAVSGAAPGAAVPGTAAAAAAAAAAGGKKAKKEKKERDPNAPKRPLTAYFLFSSSARPIVKEDLGPEAAPNDVAGEVLRRWNNMGEQEKQRWKDEYERNNTKYKAEVADYKASLGVPHDHLLPDEILGDADPTAATTTTTGAPTAGGPDAADTSDDEAPAPPPPPPAAKATGKGSKKKAKENGVAAALHSPSPSAQLMKETPIPFPGAAEGGAKGGAGSKRKRGSAAAAKEAAKEKEDEATETVASAKKPRKGKAAAAAAEKEKEDVVASTETAATGAAAGPEKKERRKKRKSEA